MLIGIDARLWNQTGVGRYTRNLIANLNVLDKKNGYVLFVRSEDEKQIRKELGVNFKVVICDIKWHSLDEQIKFASFLNFYKLDLMHFPYFSVPYLYRKKYVVTVHDLINNKLNTGRASTLPYPIFLTKKLAYKIVLSNALKKSQKIIVPSNSVREDLLSLYKNIPKEKLAVTYEGGFENKIKTSDKNIYGKYFLRVGNFYPHKNVQTLLQSLATLLNSQDSKENIKLIMVGKKDYFYKRVEEKITELKITKSVIFIENVDDIELTSLYKNSIATIVPSFMEGFSLTVVEAMSLGSLVLASDIPVHREICKEAAIFFNPKDSADLTKKIKEILELSDNKRENLIEKGLVRSNDFSWEKMARDTLKIYESSISLR